MAELTTSERLQPSLLDRLTDDEPSSKAESRERRVMSLRQLRYAVLRDLSWLLNSASRPLDDEITQFPLVARSVINYGLPDLTGLTTSGIKAGRLEQMVFEACRRGIPSDRRFGRSSPSVASARHQWPIPAELAIASAAAVPSSRRLAPAKGSAVRSLTMVWKLRRASRRPWEISA